MVDVQWPVAAKRKDQQRLGERVTFRFGVTDVVGTIIEDRGPLAAGKPLYGIRWRFDEGEDRYIELSEDEFKPVAPSS